MNIGASRYGLAVLVVSIVAAIAWTSVLMFKEWGVYHGYCGETRGYPSDRERIRSVVRYVLDTYPPDPYILVDTNNGVRVTALGRLDKRSTYTNVDDFINRNTSCCKITEIDPETGGIGFIRRLHGLAYNFVQVDYKVVFDLNGKKFTKLYRKYIPTDACGRVTHLN
ncbi:MAG: hypothetical protein J0I96_12875 [Rhodanobacter sp.]|nr:hypothetical protein [Rhodanobacter sp.]